MTDDAREARRGVQAYRHVSSHQQSPAEIKLRRISSFSKNQYCNIWIIGKGGIACIRSR